MSRKTTDHITGAQQIIGELGLRELPRTLVVDGVAVATDVLERNYATDARAVNVLARQRAAASAVLVPPSVARPVLAGPGGVSRPCRCCRN